MHARKAIGLVSLLALALLACQTAPAPKAPATDGAGTVSQGGSGSVARKRRPNVETEGSFCGMDEAWITRPEDDPEKSAGWAALSPEDKAIIRADVRARREYNRRKAAGGAGGNDADAVVIPEGDSFID